MKVSEILALQKEIGQQVQSAPEVEAIITAIEIEQEASAFLNRAGKTLRAQHAKEHGYLEATFGVNTDVVADLQVGVFQAGAQYEARIRFSNGASALQPDNRPGLQGLAIKLLNISGDNLTEGKTEQDFILVSYPNFILNDMLVMGEAMKAQVQGEESTKKFLSTHPKIYERMQEQKGYYLNPLEIQFYSVTPYHFGKQKVKYSIKPQDSPYGGSYPKGKLPPDLPPDYLQLAMEKVLDNRGVKFDFLIQFYKNDTETPIDDATVIWNTDFIKLATINIHQQYFTAPAQLKKGQMTSFNPWYGLPAHEPLGSLNVGRRYIYENLFQFRIDRNKVLPNSPYQHPLNLILKIRETPVTIKSTSGEVVIQTKTVTDNYQVLRAALSGGGTGLDSVKTIHFARNIFLDPVTKNNEDGDEEIAYYETVALITAYDEGFANYIIDFAEAIYERFNLLLSFVQGTEGIQDEHGNVKVQKNIQNFVAFIAKHDVEPVAFYSSYPDLSVVQILQNSESRDSKFTGLTSCPMGFSNSLA